MPNPEHSLDLLKQRLETFCAYQERSPEQVKQKLFKLGADNEQVQQVIKHLSKADFLDPLRFARVYARSKFTGRKWGKEKIAMHLRMQGIPQEYIGQALEEIMPEAYDHVLAELAQKKWETTKGVNQWDKKAKVMRYLVQKGYAMEVVYKALDALTQTE